MFKRGLIEEEALYPLRPYKAALIIQKLVRRFIGLRKGKFSIDLHM